MTIGIVLVAFLAALIGRPPVTKMISTLRRTSSAASSGIDRASLRISILDGDVLSFYVTKLAQSQPNCLGTGGLSSWSLADR